MKEKHPANSGNIVFCPHCAEELERHKKTTIKYCIDCGRGFAVHGDCKIAQYYMKKTELTASEFEQIEKDDSY